MATNDIVSKAEIELLAIACRLDTALCYRDEHREEPDDDWIRQGIENEMLGINEIFREAGTTVPRLPAFLRMIGERSERVLQLQEVMDLDDLSTEEMKAYCTSIANDNPQWNSLLTMHSPRDLAPQLLPVTEWWLPGEPTIEDEENAEDAAAEAAAGEEDGDGDDDDEVQIVDAPDTAGDVQPRRSGRNTKGKAPARADEASGTVDASDGGGDVEMGEVVDNQKTPKKVQPVKRAIVISPSSEVPAKRQQRRPSTAAKAAKAAGHLPNPSHNVSECKPQIDAPKSFACELCAFRKVTCNPPAAWAVDLKKALKEAAKEKQETKKSKRSTTSIMEDLPPTLEGLKERLDSMEANATAFQEATESRMGAFQEAMESRMGALQDVLYNIDVMMRALCMRNAITPSTLALRIPPVPLFVPAAPSPSPTAGPSSIASIISSTTSAPGFDISQLSIAAPFARVASGSGAGYIHTPVPLSRTPSLSRGRGGGTSKPASRASSAAGSKAPSAAGSKAPSAAGSRASSRTRD
ncbi:hypothetical protein EDB85DRAFT_2144449 [Lactarius pseudohatsudake]|nr:hypothetical protein EDB85DRAFT_2144449 [Lactarius pseudohatsudake]